MFLANDTGSSLLQEEEEFDGGNKEKILGCQAYEPGWKTPKCCFFFPVELGLRISMILMCLGTLSFVGLFVQALTYPVMLIDVVIFAGAYAAVNVWVCYYFIKFLREDTKDNREGVAKGYKLNFIAILINMAGGVLYTINYGAGQFGTEMIGALIFNYYIWKNAENFAKRTTTSDNGTEKPVFKFC